LLAQNRIENNHNKLAIQLEFAHTNLKMGLLTILKKVKQKEKELRILILGLDNAG
jgi:hypothetical protein